MLITLLNMTTQDRRSEIVVQSVVDECLSGLGAKKGWEPLAYRLPCCRRSTL